MSNLNTIKSPSRLETESRELPTKKKILYISWAESCSRSDQTARELGGKSKMVYLAWLGSHPLTICFKYSGQTLITAWHIIRERPDAIFVMSPPLLAAFPALLWKLFFRRPFVLDCHTGAFTNPRWKRLQWLQHFLCRQAATNIVTNSHLQSLVESNGGKTTIVRDVPVQFESTEPRFPLPAGFIVVAVCSFNYDEPIAAMFEAARQLSDVQFFFSGNPNRLDPQIAELQPKNVHLTGFLSDQQYGSLICGADIVLTLTTQDHTMLRGAWEAIYQATPVIVSDWPILQKSFDKGALHVDNSSDSIIQAIKFAQQNIVNLRQQAEEAKEDRLQHWQGVKEALIEAVN